MYSIECIWPLKSTSVPYTLDVCASCFVRVGASCSVFVIPEDEQPRGTMRRSQVMKRALLRNLGQTNQSILCQKVALMDSITSHFGSSRMTMELYRQKCPIVGASIGQHFRHSLDHIERAAAAAIGQGSNRVGIHYDLRSRDTPDETDWNAAKTRIDRIERQLHTLTILDATEASEDTADQEYVDACFYLNGGPDAVEVALPSTLARELGFAAHHAIHHMAMVRIIVQQQGLSEIIPSDFGRAPSTIRHDRASSQ
jgi:hypothetical protein